MSKPTPKSQRTLAAASQKGPSPKLTKTPYELSHTTEQVCGLINPFCIAADGAKYPDDSSARTLPYSVRQASTISSDANGVAGVLIVPNVQYSSLAFATAVAAGPPPSATFATLFGAPVAPLAGAAQFRIVSCGYRLKSVAPALTASGMVYMRAYAAEDASSTSVLGDFSTYAATATKNVPLRDLHDEVCIIPHTSQMPQEFYTLAEITPTANTADWNAPGFMASSVCIVGAPPNTALFEIEYVMHVEYTFEDGSALQLAATPAPVFNPLITSAANHLSSSAVTIFNTGLKKVSDHIFESARKALTAKLYSNPRTFPLALMVD